MGGRAEPPKRTDTTRLPGGGPVIGTFWADCRGKRRCGRPPYDRLLANTVLRGDYRVHRSSTRDS